MGLSRTVGPNLRGVARPARVEDSRCAARPSEALVGVGLRKAEGAAEAAAGRARKDCGRGISPLRAVAARQVQVADDMFTSSALPPERLATPAPPHGRRFSRQRFRLLLAHLSSCCAVILELP